MKNAHFSVMMPKVPKVKATCIAKKTKKPQAPKQQKKNKPC